ncbi:MAG TPA: hypothetical protein VG425_04700 [Casimicrobiaceae bacterium]|jgi:hypothetical protein|nr:hypothetical protein [Casimicrobiaceae bacterium]
MGTIENTLGPLFAVALVGAAGKLRRTGLEPRMRVRGRAASRAAGAAVSD